MDDFKRRAGMVATQDQRFRAADAKETDATEDLLRVVLTEIAPALPSLASKIPGMELRGLALIHSGRMDQDTLFLLADGRLATIRRSGEKVAGTVLTAGDVAASWPINEILASISQALDAQLRGNKDRRTDEAETRAERLRAIATLVRK